jgi:hypothetical protein
MEEIEYFCSNSNYCLRIRLKALTSWKAITNACWRSTVKTTFIKAVMKLWKFMAKKYPPMAPAESIALYPHTPE